MKKSLIALAVLAASGASFAQSSVTLYGLADVWVGYVDAEVNGVSKSNTVMESGGVNTSRWGIKGSEDLGGGLKANFLLEQGFNLDTGAAKGTNQAFARQAYVGFSGGFGEVKLGKVWTAYDDVSGASNAMFDSGPLAPMNNVFYSVNYQGNPGNTIYYSTPTFSGFGAAISYSLDENVGDAVTSANLTYGAGPLAVQFGYQIESPSGTGEDAEFLRLGGSWDFGMAVLKATYGQVNNFGNVNNADSEEYQIGVDVPVGKSIVVSASYATSEGSGAIDGIEADGWGIAASYTLSKRTFLYTGYTDNSADAPGVNVSGKAFAVGVQHKF
jgi:predicted porin